MIFLPVSEVGRHVPRPTDRRAQRGAAAKCLGADRPTLIFNRRQANIDPCNLHP